MKALLLICAVLLALPLIALATPVPDTGQTRCYDGTQEIPCPNPGEPFYGQDGNYSVNPWSYTKLDSNGSDLPDNAPWPWAMVRDNVTGLVWEVKTDDDSIHDKDNTYTWFEAQDVFVAALNSAQFGSHNDWRLPTVHELSSLVDRNRYAPSPSINTEFFPNTLSSNYWSTIIDYSPDSAWVVDFHDGYVNWDGTMDGSNYARAVRGGQCGSQGHFIDNGDNTITDTDSNLMWGKFKSMAYYNWQESLQYCESSWHAGYDDWRLPDANELQSLINYNNYAAIDPIFAGGGFGMTSTSLANDPYHVWFILDDGLVTVGTKENDNYVRCVRSGQCVSFGDSDNDCRIDCIDNCLSTPNAPTLGTCTKGSIGQSCTMNEECGSGGLCNVQQEDTDSDYLGDACDNCPDQPNGPVLGTCIAGEIGQTCNADIDCNCVGWCRNFVCGGPCPITSGLSCFGPNDCYVEGICYKDNQLDTLPPQGNALGDACECEGNFNCAEDQDVDGTDAALLKVDFGRGGFNSPCIAGDTCNGDFSCDGDVDGSDAALFKQDFGRSQFQNPCPACNAGGGWCQY